MAVKSLDNEILPYAAIYFAVNLRNGKRYVGQTKQNPPHKRWKEECKPEKKKTYHFANAMRKVKKDIPDVKFNYISDTEAEFGYFHFEVIDQWRDEMTQKDLDLQEILGIEIFYSLSYNGSGYNKTTGGGGTPGYKPSAEQIERTGAMFRELWQDPKFREKTLKSRREYWDSLDEEARRLIWPHLFRPKTDAEKQNLREKGSRPKQIEHCRRIQKLGAEARKKRIVAYKNGELFGPYESQTDCARILGVSDGHITDCIKNNRGHAGGYIFKETDANTDEDLNIVMNEMRNTIIRLKVSKGTFSKEYDNIELVLDDLPHLTRSEILRCSKNGNKHKGYKIERTRGSVFIRLQTGAKASLIDAPKSA